MQVETLKRQDGSFRVNYKEIPLLVSYSKISEEDAVANLEKALCAYANRHIDAIVTSVPTATKAFDCDIMNDIWVDEMPKSVSEVAFEWSEDKTSVRMIKPIAGKVQKTFYIPVEDSTSFKEAKQIFEGK